MKLFFKNKLQAGFIDPITLSVLLLLVTLPAAVYFVFQQAGNQDIRGRGAYPCVNPGANCVQATTCCSGTCVIPVGKTIGVCPPPPTSTPTPTTTGGICCASDPANASYVNTCTGLTPQASCTRFTYCNWLNASSCPKVPTPALVVGRCCPSDPSNASYVNTCTSKKPNVCTSYTYCFWSSTNDCSHQLTATPTILLTSTPAVTTTPVLTPTATIKPSLTPTPAGFCIGPNDLKMNSPTTCMVVYHGTFSESNGQGCCTLGNAPNGTSSCTLVSKPTCPNNGTPQCYGTTWICPVPTTILTPTPAAFCTGPNDQKMSSVYTCFTVYQGAFSESNGQGCCTLGTAPNGTTTCPLLSKPLCPNNVTPQCNGTTWTCPVPTTIPTPTSTLKLTPTPTLILSACTASMSIACKKWGADGCIVPKGGSETCTLNGHYYYSQNDPRWAGNTLTCSDGTTDTFGNSGCGETTLSMLMSQYVDSSYTPNKVTNDFFGNGYCGGTGYIQDTDILKQYGFTVEQKSVSADNLKNYVRDGWQVWAYVQYGLSAHQLLITGVDNSGNFIVNDPYYGGGELSATSNSEYPYGTDNLTAFYLIKPPSND